MAKDDRFSMSRNFLATDKVPDTIFGIPVVSRDEDYTPEDIAFFHEHPEAGGYYDLGEGSPEDGTEEGMPTQADAAGNAWERAQAEAQRRRQAILEGRLEPTSAEEQLYDMTEVRRARQERLRREKARLGPGGRKSAAKGGDARGAYPGSLNNPGNVEKRRERREGEVASPHERWARFATPQDGLREMARAIRQIADVKLAKAGQPFTIRNWANVYAPERSKDGTVENDTKKYVADISSTSGLDADAPLDRRSADDMATFLKTVVRFESGVPHSRWFTDDEYRTAAEELEEGATD